jgi:hypothetical protein
MKEIYDTVEEFNEAFKGYIGKLIYLNDTGLHMIHNIIPHENDVNEKIPDYSRWFGTKLVKIGSNFSLGEIDISIIGQVDRNKLYTVRYWKLSDLNDAYVKARLIISQIGHMLEKNDELTLNNVKLK